jgi:hypothetical protein
MAREQLVNGRDRRDRLVCQVPGCRTRIYGETGFQEAEKLMRHLNKAHLMPLDMTRALELRVKWEESDARP